MEENKMKEWLLFILFILVGLGMLCTGLIYMRKEKSDLESVKIYRVISIIGAVLTVAAILMQFVF
jgi:heme/copper-type cytochrome/quinol oxidase subunit 1